MPEGARKSAIVIKVGYDADAALAAFAAGLKDAVDLDSIRDDLATVVHQAWRPLVSRCGSARD